MTAQGQARSLHKRERAASGGLHHESLHGQTGYENDLCRGALEEYWPGKAVSAKEKDAARTETQDNEHLVESFICVTGQASEKKKARL